MDEGECKSDDAQLFAVAHPVVERLVEPREGTDQKHNADEDKTCTSKCFIGDVEVVVAAPEKQVV